MDKFCFKKFLLVFFLLSSCNEFESGVSPIVFEDDEEQITIVASKSDGVEELYNLGDDWSRSLTKVFHKNHKTVLKAVVGSHDGLASSNFIFLKKTADLIGVFVATRHSLPFSCEESGIVFLSKDQEYRGSCLNDYAQIPETDAVMFSVQFYNKNSFDQLIPAKLIDEPLNGGKRVKFYGVDSDDLIPGYYPLISDSSSDCLLLSDEEKQISDPDIISPVGSDPYWSYVISCDVMHGDSGGMVVDRENNMVGMLWTGATPKLDISSAEIKRLSRSETLNDEELKWSQFNYIVPSYRIKSFLKDF